MEIPQNAVFYTCDYFEIVPFYFLQMRNFEPTFECFIISMPQNDQNKSTCLSEERKDS